MNMPANQQWSMYDSMLIFVFFLSLFFSFFFVIVVLSLCVLLDEDVLNLFLGERSS